jgi:outer membrane protein OmpA-like peptidoglycan-associated protein
MYDLGARMYDPSIGRFMIVDPLADFINYQSSYAFADNNPILNVDEYGFGILRAIGNIFSRIGFGIKKVFTGGTCDCRRFQGESLRDAWNMPDFQGNNNRGSSRSNNRNKPSDNSNNNTPTPEREKITSIDIPQLAPPNVPALEINAPNINIPFAVQTSIVSRPKPTFRGQVLDSKTTINFNISFMQSRFLVEPTDTNLKIINDLVKTLKEYPEIKLLLSGNMLTSDSDNNVVNTLEGRMSVSSFKNERAKAILKILEKNGIPTSRIQTKPGNSGSMSIDATFTYKK